MDITAILTSFIYLVSSSLLVPVLLLLASLTVWLLIYSGSFAGSWFVRSRLSHQFKMIETMNKQQFANFPASVKNFSKRFVELKNHDQAEIAVLNLLRETEHRLWKSLDSLKMLIRIGPGLGLVGTLIPMGTGLAALGQGDLTRLSGDLVIAFTTTVVGMTLGMVSYFFFTIQRRWVEEDVKNMELICELDTGKTQS